MAKEAGSTWYSHTGSSMHGLTHLHCMFFSLRVAAGLWHSSGGGRLKRNHGRCMDLAVVDTWLTIATSSRHLGCSGSMAARKPHTWRGGRASTQTPGSGRSWSSGPSSGTQVGLLDPAAWRRLGSCSVCPLVALPGQRAWPWLWSWPQLPWRPAWPSWSHPCPSCPSWARWAWSWSCPWRRLGCWPKGWLEVSGQEVAADTAKMSKNQCMQTALWHAMKMIAWKLYQHHGSEIKFVYYVQILCIIL